MSSGAHPVLRKLAALERDAAPLPAPQFPTLSEIEGDAELERLFAARLEELRGQYHPAATAEGAAKALRSILRDVGSVHVGCADVPWLTSLAVRAGAATLSHDVAMADTYITPAHVLVAELGAVVIAASAMAPRAATCLPPVHIVVAQQAQIVLRLSDAMGRLRDATEGGTLPSDIVVIAGPSRTADIEKTLVIPAHGPRELHVVVVGSRPSA